MNCNFTEIINPTGSSVVDHPSQVIPNSKFTENVVSIDKLPEEFLGLTVVSWSEQDCFPSSFPNQPGVYVVRVVKNSPAARAGLKIGDRILEVNGAVVNATDYDKATIILHQAGNKMDLRIRKHGPPSGFLVIELARGEGELLGMCIQGGVDSPANPLNLDDIGIFISKIERNGAIDRNGLAKIGMRVLCVNGNPLFNTTHDEAVSLFPMIGQEIEILLTDGYDPEKVKKLRGKGKLPRKII